MNPLAGNLLVPQEETNRPTTMMSLAHCIFNWKIHKICLGLACNAYCFESSIFELTDRSKWRLCLCTRNEENMCIFKVHLCRLPGESSLERIKVRFCLKLQLPAGHTLDSLRNEAFSFEELDHYVYVYEIHRSTLQDFLYGVENDDTLVIKCEMLAAVATNAVSDNPHPGNQYFSKNLIKLLEDSFMTNVSLLVEGNRHIKAHKEILSIWSNKFAELLTETSRCCLKIPFYTYEVVKAMLTFVYSGNFNELTINDPPPIELCECAEYYGIIGLADILRPLEKAQVHTIENTSYSCSWYIPNFRSSYAARNVIELPPVDEEGFRGDSEVLANSEMKLRVDFTRDDCITFYIEVSRVDAASVISNDIKFSDLFSYETFSVRQIKQLLDYHTCTFQVSLAFSFDYMNRRPLYDVFSIRCDFRYVSPHVRYNSEGALVLRDFDSSGYNWNIVSTRIEELFRPRPHTDIEIDVKSHQAPITKSAHKSVLRDRCPVCQALLSCQNEGGNLFLGCASYSARELLYYMYTGILRYCSVRTLIDLHDFTRRFWIPELRVKCFGLLHLKLNRFTACKICLLADDHGYRYLKWKCFDCIFENQNLFWNTFRLRELISKKLILAQEIAEYISQRN